MFVDIMAALAEASETKTPVTSQFSCKILIIGAGIAGISVAHHLIKKGETDFKILEARNRIGGRIVSIPMGVDQVDLGASWIHGVMENPIYELALSNELINITIDQDPHAVVATTEEGKRVPISVVDEVYNAYFWFSKRCEEYFLLHLHTPPNIESVGKHLEMDINAYLQQYHGDEANMRRMIFDHLLSRETCITGCHSMDETSLSDFGSYTELPGGNISIPGGFCSVVKILEDILPRDSVRLQCEVKQIKWKMKNDSKTDDNEKSVCNKSNLILVTCGDGTNWLASHVIVTLPLGVLKATANDMFEPKLPDYKIECIENLSFGIVNKIYLEYDRPFLNAEISEVITLWKRTEESDISKIWFRKIYSFRRCTESILLAWVSGREAEFLETLSEEQVAETCTDILRKFLNDPYVPKPCKVVCTSWKSHPFSKGSYTYIGLKSSQRDIELLATPIYSDPYHSKPALLFAGEATHPTFYSTTHGAYLSGQKCADILTEPDSDSGQKQSRQVEASDRDLSSWIKGIDLS
ncbi:peroxisomal N(1)-acetyl-spermine/spermidine oxidase [Parasteatoda tepidariorum]|nr:peroxisomal N(1)-acetyl-spermine/spermidine oxidase [Parasteatoda tepidariorum]